VALHRPVVVGGGKGMVGSGFRVQLSTLQLLGSRLTQVASTIESGAVFPEATGAEAYSDITSALDQYREDWDNAVVRLQKKIGDWGAKVSVVGTLMGDHDTGLAESLRAPAGAP
jgi:hypothetical protein